MVEDYEKPRGSAIDFLKELENLLDKYNVEIVASDEWLGYAECGQDIQIRIKSDFTAPECYSIPFGETLSKDTIRSILSKVGN